MGEALLLAEVGIHAGTRVHEIINENIVERREVEPHSCFPLLGFGFPYQYLPWQGVAPHRIVVDPRRDGSNELSKQRGGSPLTPRLRLPMLLCLPSEARRERLVRSGPGHKGPVDQSLTRRAPRHSA